jgi:hypothetical protein
MTMDAVFYDPSVESDIKPIRMCRTGPDEKLATDARERGLELLPVSAWPDVSRQGVRDGVIVDRPEFVVLTTTIPADGTEHVIIEALPAGTRISSGGTAMILERDEPLVMQATEPAIKRVSIEPPFPWVWVTLNLVAS